MQLASCFFLADGLIPTACYKCKYLRFFWVGQDVTTCGGATLPWREVSDKAKQKGGGTKADLLACMRDLNKCGLAAAKFARSLPGVKRLIKMVRSRFFSYLCCVFSVARMYKSIYVGL